jgi:hypothetical protein
MGKKKAERGKNSNSSITQGNSEKDNKINRVGLFKYRSQNQIAEDASIRLFLKVLPEAWIWRMMVPDYGIDMELELVEPDSTVDIKGNIETVDPQQLTVTGQILWVQLKSTYNLKVEGDYVVFDLETALLRHIAGCQIPSILVVVDLKNKAIYWKHLQNYIREASRNHDFGWWMNSSTVRVRIPKLSQIIDDSSGAFATWRHLATENALTRELVAMQANLYRARVIMRTVTVCEQQQKKSLLIQVSAHMSAICCSGLLFFEPSFREGWELREQVLNPLIDYIDATVEAEEHDVDCVRVQATLEQLSEFATQISEQLSI